MKITTQEFENGQAVFHIEVEPPELEKSMEEAYHELAKKVNIPGFRKGKVPRAILQNYVGREGLQEEALEHLIPQLCDQAAEEQKLEVIAQPQAEILETDPVVFKATFPLRPKVELGDYHSIRLAPEPVEVTEEQIDNAIEQLRQRNAVWVPAERPVQYGDLATIDIEQRPEKGDPLNYAAQQYPVIENSPLPLPGFAEQVAGMEKNQEKEFAISFPDDYEVSELAGQEYNFKVKVTEVKEKNLPELNDEFAKSVADNVETLDALREAVADRLKAAAEEQAKREFEGKVIEAAVGLARVEFPPVLVERETDRMLTERDNMLRAQGGLEAYLRNIGKTEEEIREELKPQATTQLIQSLVVGKVSEEEKIEVSAAEIDAEIENITKAADDKAEELRTVFDTPQARRWTSDRLLLQKTMQRLTEIATGNAVVESAAAEEAAEERADENKSTEGEADSQTVS